MIALIITNIILIVVIGAFGVASLIEMAKDSRPIIIKEAKALREYYESKLKELQEKTDKAEQKQAEYKGLYEAELQKNGDVSSLRSRKFELERQVERLIRELNSSDDRINDMVQENADLKEKIKALKKPASNSVERRKNNEKSDN